MILPVPLHVPAGYERLQVGAAQVVARRDVAAEVRAALHDADAGTLYGYAAAHPRVRTYQGRIPAYGAPLPGGGLRVVVRHGHHGGALAAVTGDRFLPPTRAPRELRTALRLARLGVRTPELLAIARYPAGPWGTRLFLRSDVVSREIEGGRDLAAILAQEEDAARRTAALDAAARLLSQLARAGVRHPDLNLKNLLVVEAAGGCFEAFLLDVDRVRFHLAGDDAVAEENLARFERSARKWVRTRGLRFDERELLAFDRRARELRGH